MNGYCIFHRSRKYKTDTCDIYTPHSIYTSNTGTCESCEYFVKPSNIIYAVDSPPKDTLIYDEAMVSRFLSTVLPPLEKSELIVIQLIARRKYSSLVEKSNIVCAKDYIHHKSDPITKIKRMARCNELYIAYDSGQYLPMSAFGLYINLNPKDGLRGYFTFSADANKRITQYINTENPEHRPSFSNIFSLLFSAVTRSNSRKLYTLVDIDKKDEELLIKIVELIGAEHIIWVTETHGGFHMIVKKNKESSARVYQIKNDVIHIHSEPLTVIPGTVQGGFMAREVVFV